MTKWRPTDPALFVKDYLAGSDNFTLANTYKGSPDQVKRFIKALRDSDGLPSRDEIAEGTEYTYRGEGDRRAFRDFLSRSRTLGEITDRFGDSTDSLLASDYEGYSLLRNLDDYGRTVYSLLPKVEREVRVEPKCWQFYRSQREDSQAYLLVNLPESLFENTDEEVRLVPLFDVHLGHHAHKADKFLAYLKYIEETPNVFTWLGGDLLENALDDGRGMTYEQAFGPTTQIEQATYLLSRIAHKVLFAQPGNHEWRTYNKAGIDPMKVVADRLEIPYFDGPVFCSVVSAGRKWVVYSQHGNGNSQTKGGKMNMAGRARRFTDGVDFFVSGHVHDPVVASETVIREDPMNARLVYPAQWTVVAPSFLGWSNTYAYRAGYAPPGAGGVSLHLYANGDYEARLSNKG